MLDSSARMRTAFAKNEGATRNVLLNKLRV